MIDAIGTGTASQEWSVRMADSVMHRRPLLSRRWHYEPGVALAGIKQVWLQTNERKYYEYIKRNIDEFVRPNGDIRTYRLEEYNLDQINAGKLLFLLYNETGDEAKLEVLCNHKTSWHTQSSHCHPTWSWDGSRILYASDYGGRVNLYLVEP